MDGAFEFSEEELEQVRRATRMVTIEHHRQIPSTNTRALALAEESTLALPAVILTDLQTAGRGAAPITGGPRPGR